jgi:hypothetical protein
LTEQGRYAAGNEAFFQKSLDLLILSNGVEHFRGNRQILYQIEFDNAFEEALAGGSRGK